MPFLETCLSLVHKIGESKVIKSKYYKWLITAFILLAPYPAISGGPGHWKQPQKPRTEAALQADAFFWEVFHNGQYELIPAVLEALKAVHLTNPNDAITTAHVGFMHAWHLTERWRMDSIPPSITDDIVLSQSYFQQAVRLNPADKRYLGFLGGMTLAEGDLHGDKKLAHKGYSTLVKAVHAYPEFNLVTAGLIESSLPPTSERFQRALEWQWKVIDVCIGEKIDRANPDMSPYMHLVTTEGRKRVCWNGWIAPHNFEGTFLNMGDMLVKSGDWKTAQKIYANAKLTPEYPNWQYRDFLEQRIAEAEANVALFNAPPGPSGRPDKPVMFQTEFACMSCHQN